MAKKLCVIEVIVKYAIDGKSFTVSFDPMEVGAIFFDEKDKNAAIAAQKPTPVENPLPAAAAIPPKVGAARTFARTVAKGRSKRTSGPALWWHTNECNWFHPGD
jgi:hypothetical protein